MSNIILMPEPKEVRYCVGSYKLPDSGYIVLLSDHNNELISAARKLQDSIDRQWRISASSYGDGNIVSLVCEPGVGASDEAYSLDVTARGIEIRATGPAGVYYGVCTLCQILAQCGDEIPYMSMRDWPDFAVRGVMLDVSRDKVPTLQTLFDLADLLSSWKINHIELYTEHTFEYKKHPIVWAEASPITGEDVLTLDKYCAERFIELTPNQNSFGHLERWLKHEKYLPLAEAPNGFDTPWSHIDHPFSLNPIDPGSIELVRDMYDELLPHFSSRLFNVGLDETFDLGQGKSKELCEKLGTGRVYLDFLLKIHQEVKRRGRTMLFWGDIMNHHPELISELPGDIIALEWGYEANHPFKENCERYRSAGVPFWVCPGTSSWNSIGGRTDNAIANLKSAAENGYAAGATGFLNTDWGDYGHWQYLPVSYLGFMYGGAVSWNSTQGADDIERALDLFAFFDSASVMGKAAADMGRVQNKIAKSSTNCNNVWRQLKESLSNLTAVEDITAEEFTAAADVARSAKATLANAKMSCADSDLIIEEYTNTADMLILGCDLGKIRLAIKNGEDAAEQKAAAKRDLQRIIANHERLWLSRNRPGGLVDSKKWLENRLAEL